MTIRHHIGEDLLLAYAAGSLSEAWSLVVATHAAMCPHCRGTLRDIEAIGGHLLDTQEPVSSDDGAFERVMERLGGELPAPRPVPPAPEGRPPVLPQPLRGYVGGDLHELSWRWLAPGSHHLALTQPGSSTRVFLLKVQPGMPVPEHGHRGQELTLVLSGAFDDRHLHFGRGDVQEADPELEHQPIAAAGEACVCLVVVDQRLRFRTWAARLLQPFIGI